MSTDILANASDETGTAARLHSDSVIFEGHRDCYELVNRLRSSEVDPLHETIIPRLRQGGVDAVVYAVGGDSVAHSRGLHKPLLATLQNVDAVRRAVETNPERSSLITTAADVPDNPADRISILMHLEGGSPLSGSLEVLRSLFTLGVRSMQLLWNVRNELGDGVIAGASTKGGLTNFGVSVVKEMERLQMCVDLAHASEEGFWHALKVAERPVMVSHANSRELMDHPRNLWDDQARAVADQGGVIGAVVVPKFLHPSNATVTHLTNHILHFAEVIGCEHVGLGLDFSASDGPRPTEVRYPGKQDVLEGLAEVDSLTILTESLLAKGMSESEVSGVLGANFARYFSTVLPQGNGSPFVNARSS